MWATDILRTYLDWPGHGQVVKIERRFRVKGETTRHVRHVITILGPQTPPAKLFRLLRGHWGIENGLHYVREVTMGEDASQVRKDSAPQVMAGLRNLVLRILRLSGATNIAETIRKVGWQPNGALRLLGLRP